MRLLKTLSATFFFFVGMSPVWADYLGTENLRIYPTPIDDVTDGFDAGDRISFVIEVTPEIIDDNKPDGHAAWSTFYIPDGAKVIDARYLTPAGPLTTSAAEAVDNSYDGCGQRGCYGYDSKDGDGVELSNGYVNEVQQDTGIFYSTDSRTQQNFGLSDVSPTGVAANQPYNTWDRDQVLAFGEGTALVGNTGKGNTPIIRDTNVAAGADQNLWFGTGSAVAGPDTYYQYDYYPDCNATNGSSDLVKDLQCVGPWQRIEVLGDQIGASGTIADDAVPALTPFVNTAVDATGGHNFDNDGALPLTTNALRIVHGARRLGDIERWEITLQITDATLFVAALDGTNGNGPEICADSVPGDTSTTAAKDNNWRYYEVSRSCADLNSQAALVKTITNTSGSNGIAGSVQPGDAITYEFVFTNLSDVALTNVVATDVPISQLTLKAPGVDGCPAAPIPTGGSSAYDGVVSDPAGVVLFTGIASWATYASLAAGETITYTVCGTVDGGAANGKLVTNEARVTFTECVLAAPCLTSTVIIPVSNSIAGTKYNDLDASGDYTSGEPGIEGVTIDLYEDNGTAGVLDGADIHYATTTTDINGDYSFTAVATGDYIIVEVALAGLTATGDYDNAVQPASCAANNTCNVIGGSAENSGASSTLAVLPGSVIGDRDFFNALESPNLTITKVNQDFGGGGSNEPYEAGDGKSGGTQGDQFEYILLVSNIGVSNATGVVVTDTLPDEVTYISAALVAPATGSCNAAPATVVTCSITDGILTGTGVPAVAGGTAEIKIIVEAN